LETNGAAILPLLECIQVVTIIGPNFNIIVLLVPYICGASCNIIIGKDVQATRSHTSNFAPSPRKVGRIARAIASLIQ